jgi:sodium-dependent dicarboxylate transporter 2/3/5
MSAEHRSDGPHAKASASRARPIIVAAAFVCAAMALLASGWAEGLNFGARATLGVFVLVAVLWVSGAVEAFAAGLLGVAALALALTVGWGGGEPVMDLGVLAGEFVSTPVLMMLAGLSMAAAASSIGVDRLIARTLLLPLAHRPATLMSVVMLTGAGLSMFMNNTSTAVLLLALIVPMVRPLGEGSRSARALVLAAALGTALGSLVTPIGTPPNLIAFGMLREAGHGVSFAGWVARGAVVAACVLLTAWLLLRRLAAGFVDWDAGVMHADGNSPGWRGWAWGVVFLLTIGLWVTQPWTGVPLRLASLLPLAALPMLGLLRAGDLGRIDWATLALTGAGLCLGEAMSRTGLAAWIVHTLAPAGAPGWVLAGVFCLLAVGLSTFISNTATANLMLPLCLALPREDVIVACAMATALGSSMAVAIPIATPPVLLASASGLVRPRELLGIGLAVALVGTVAATLTLSLTL